MKVNGVQLQYEFILCLLYLLFILFIRLDYGYMVGPTFALLLFSLLIVFLAFFIKPWISEFDPLVGVTLAPVCNKDLLLKFYLLYL